MMEDFVNVSVRIRPPDEKTSDTCVQIISKQPAVMLVTEKSQTYHFDNIFTDDVKQVDIYNDTVKKLVGKVKAGYNCTVFAYGQTGTGKTYTIGTNPTIKDEEEVGLISRTLEDFFSTTDEHNEVEIDISFIEIYNEKVFDLLSVDNKIPLTVKGFKVHGFKQIKVSDTFEALQYLKIGSSKRHIGETKQNSSSSRSHAIFSIHCCTRDMEKETSAKINLVDLAGSESVRKTGNQGSSFYEGININKGLLSLGQVMTALSSNSSHIPYRQSVITTILQDSLNKRNFISLIACVSSHVDDMGETLHTLEFSSRVKKMRNKPEVNEFIVQYKKENPSLFVSNTQKSQTPMKRSHGFIYETPFKKPKIALPLINEPIHSANSSNFDMTPLFSSSMTSTVGETQQNFSPVIRKYINAMENSLMNKLENVIRNTLKRPKVSAYIEDKENLMEPRTLENGFNKNVTPETMNQDGRSPGVELNLSNCSMSSRSSPDALQMINLESASKNFFSGDNQFTTDAENDFIFKVPAPKKSSAKTASRKTRRSSTQQTESSNKRRSVRLQLKQHVENNNNAPANMSVMSGTKLENSARRRSVRIQKKQNENSVFENKKPSTRRLTRTPAINRVSESQNFKDSPMTKRTRHVLNILNKGSVKDLEKLHTVGSKTAEKIFFFREMQGEFEAISDIAEMPYWTKKKYDKFVAENFLRI